MSKMKKKKKRRRRIRDIPHWKSTPGFNPRCHQNNKNRKCFHQDENSIVFEASAADDMDSCDPDAEYRLQQGGIEIGQICASHPGEGRFHSQGTSHAFGGGGGGGRGGWCCRLCPWCHWLGHFQQGLVSLTSHHTLASFLPLSLPSWLL